MQHRCYTPDVMIWLPCRCVYALTTSLHPTGLSELFLLQFKWLRRCLSACDAQLRIPPCMRCGWVFVWNLSHLCHRYKSEVFPWNLQLFIRWSHIITIWHLFNLDYCLQLLLFLVLNHHAAPSFRRRSPTLHPYHRIRPMRCVWFLHCCAQVLSDDQRQRHRSWHNDGFNYHSLHVHIRLRRYGHERLRSLCRINPEYKHWNHGAGSMDYDLPGRWPIRRPAGCGLLGEPAE